MTGGFIFKICYILKNSNGNTKPYFRGGNGMEDILSQIVDCEKQAQQILQQAQQRRINFNVAVTEEVEELRKHYIDRAQRRIEKYRDNEQQYLNNMLREIDEKRESQLIRIKTAYDENSEKWISDIFNSIISGI